MDHWIKEAMHIRKQQDKSINRDDWSYQLPRDIWRRTEVTKTIPRKATGVVETSIEKKILKVVF